jgi:hypothetical protein
VYCLHSLNQLTQFPALRNLKLSNTQYFALWNLGNRTELVTLCSEHKTIENLETTCVKYDFLHVILSSFAHLKKLRISVDFLCDETLHMICSLST